MLPLVHIIVLTFNGRRHLEGCFSSLRYTEYTNYRVWLVDNASVDGSGDFVAERFPEVGVLRNRRNLGFARGNNLVILRAFEAGADYVVLLNDDTLILDSRWLTRAVELAEREPGTGMIGFQVLNSPAAPFLPEGTHPADRIVDSIEGCSLFMRASLLKAIGLLDEVYFAYAEEDDLEVRARRAGAQLRKIAVPIYHAGGATSKKFPIKASYLQMRNSIRFSIKQRSLWKTMARIGKIIDVACNPGSLFLDPKDNSHLRMRAQGHILTNLAILLCAVGWNVLFLPQTLLIRRRENRRIAAARALLNSPASRPRTGNPPMQAATAAAGAAAPPRTQEISNKAG